MSASFSLSVRVMIASLGTGIERTRSGAAAARAAPRGAAAMAGARVAAQAPEQARPPVAVRLVLLVSIFLCVCRANGLWGWAAGGEIDRVFCAAISTWRFVRVFCDVCCAVSSAANVCRVCCCCLCL